MREVRFREVQWSAGRVVAYAGAPLVGAGLGALVVGLWSGDWGRSSSLSAAFVGAVTYAVGVTLSLLFSPVYRMETEVRDDGVYVRLFPPFDFSFRKIALDGVVRAEAAFFSEKDYPRRSKRARDDRDGKGYFVRDGEGVRLEYSSGGHVMIGSERVRELADAIGVLWREER